MKTIKISSASILMALLVGCGSTPPTAEEQAQVNKMRSAFITALQNNSSTQVQQPQQQSQPQEVAISNSELLGQVDEVKASGGAAIFEHKRDGILIDGKMFLDPEGQVVKIGVNTINGEFTYVVKSFDGSFILKFFKANSQSAPITIAKIHRNQGMMTARTVTGQTVTGNNLIPTSNGFVVTRDGSAFQYKIGGNLNGLSVIDGYHIASLQKGDIASTGYILLEKDEKKETGVSGFLSALDSIGNTLGVTTADHYVLANLDTGKLVPLDVHIDGKKEAVYSNCRRKNSLVNECDNMEMVEALYDKMGLKNSSHYFWAVDWINTPTGPLAFYKTSAKLRVVDIQQEKMHVLFSRTLGVGAFDLFQNKEGKVSITATLGFSSETIDDVEKFIASAQAENTEPMLVLGE
jgi:hypothetical protein